MRGIGSTAVCLRSLLQNHVRVCSTNTEGADAGAPWQLSRLPVGQRIIYIEGTVREIDSWVRLLEMQCCGQHPVAYRESGLDQSGYAGRCIQVPDVCLGGSDCAKLLLFGACPKSLCKSRYFDGIGERGTGAVSFYLSNGFGIDAGHCMRLAN